jgi:glycosyltransferase involved in cell wall biosynthesis
MTFLLDLSALLIAIMLLLAVFNFFTLRVVFSKESTPIDQSVSILIPMRNEAENVIELITLLKAQSNLNDFEIIALDDSSSDNTKELLLGISQGNLKIIAGRELEEGWLGKNYACYQLAKAATGEYLVFLDADVRLKPEAIASTIDSMRAWNWDFISAYPRQVAITFLERLTQPLLQWSWFTTLPLRISEKWPRPSTVVANGQFMVIRRKAYFDCDGHEGVKAEVLDDLYLARNLVRAGARGGVADGSSVANCRMYSSASQLIEGYAKSQWSAFINPLGALLAISLLTLTSILPFAAGISGELSGWYLYFAIVITRVLSGIKTRTIPSASLLHPLSALIWIYLIILSWIKKYRGELTWRGRKL